MTSKQTGAYPSSALDQLDNIHLAMHELRSAVHIISTYATMLLEHQQSMASKPAFLVQRILLNANFTQRMLVDLLELLSIESSQPNLREETFSLAAELEGLMLPFAKAAEDKGLNFRLELVGIPRLVRTDRMHLTQIIANLLANAVAYTDTGEIEAVVHAVKRLHPKDQVVLQIIVSDPGRGIGNQEQKQIFTMFERGQSSRGIRGSGLGLAIAKKMAIQMGGDVQLISSAPSEGSRFSLEIPVTCFNESQP